MQNKARKKNQIKKTEYQNIGKKQLRGGAVLALKHKGHDSKLTADFLFISVSSGSRFTS